MTDKGKLLHDPLPQADGKWESKKTLRKYLKKRDRKNKLARAARKRNR